MDAELTIDLLATALRGLEHDVFPDTDEKTKELALRQFADTALRATAVSLKFLLASHGQATIPGFGTFAVVQGDIRFSPDPDLSQYARLAESDADRRFQALASTIVRLLQESLGLLQHAKGALDRPIEVPTTAEQKLMHAIFNDVVQVTLRDEIVHLATSLQQAVKPTGMWKKGDQVQFTRPPASYAAPAAPVLPVVGGIYDGRVTKVADFGAFVELFPGGEPALLHVSELALHRVKDIHSEVKEGQTLRVEVIKIDERGQVFLSRKTVGDPSPAPTVKSQPAAPVRQTDER